jgi:hypothetical protein
MKRQRGRDRGQAAERVWYGAGSDLDGAGTRNRTADLLITNQSLYRLSYSGGGRDFPETGKDTQIPAGCKRGKQTLASQQRTRTGRRRHTVVPAESTAVTS